MNRGERGVLLLLTIRERTPDGTAIGTMMRSVSSSFRFVKMNLKQGETEAKRNFFFFLSGVSWEH